ncbi:ATP:cob(I)alamin adenosyltransferase [Sediminicola luteus]|uniref:Cobalamin adenosyltransferase-like domain-containing protein n=1 Tax=Sediminicola luteus TaxID=319238 RepID=A0A2A4G6G3_9FLAO|nr:ATP:cob(I)alamin adenosyltransferase [Sediminicola luteus]PCE64021.1 hypothetical protein B7P33_12290 [Sediminicola luteus]
MEPKKNRLRPKAHIDELCYPFIYEDSLLCDYEIQTDQLTRLLGWVLSDLRKLQGQYPNTELLEGLEEHLNWIQPCCYHLNGSLRGKLALTEADHGKLLGYYREMKIVVKDRISGFVLPGGPAPVGQLNQCSSLAKKAIRLMVRLHNDEGLEVPEILPKFANLLCNYFFVATLVINKVTGFEETPFISKSYK